MTSSNKDQTSFKDGVVNYFKGIRVEWGKITWPEKQQVIAETIYVIVIVFVFTLFVLLLDLLFGGISEKLQSFTAALTPILWMV